MKQVTNCPVCGEQLDSLNGYVAMQAELNTHLLLHQLQKLAPTSLEESGELNG